AEVSSEGLADEWVTHLFTDVEGLSGLDPEPLEDLRAVILEQGPSQITKFGAAEAILTLDELLRRDSK
ncbi:hypothetical protein NDR87_20240, partial [Nocardia sp. CDC159]